jgi:23S rRNA (cytosine1962-C5)-methyltransferase
MHDQPKSRPRITLLPGHEKRARHGHPWIYSNEIAMDAAAKALPPGTLVTVVTAEGTQVAAATFNPHTLIAARVLTREAGSHIHDEFVRRRLRRALDIRERLYPRPFYRLVHAEADGLPGLVVDRYGDVLAAQVNTAGMALLWPSVLESLQALLSPRAVVLRGDSPARTQEGLPLGVEVAAGELDGPVEIEENGGRFPVDVLGGQKTGWFFDQRDNRACRGWRRRASSTAIPMVAASRSRSPGRARSVLAIDRSEPALASARGPPASAASRRCAASSAPKSSPNWKAG